jgi:hypothetical protein
MALLLDINTTVPPAPHLQGGKHATLAAHVTKSSLATSVGSTSGHTWNTRHGTSCSPGLSAVLHTSVHVNGMSLASVLGNVGVHEIHDVRADGSLEHWGKWDVLV